MIVRQSALVPKLTEHPALVSPLPEAVLSIIINLSSGQLISLTLNKVSLKIRVYSDPCRANG